MKLLIGSLRGALMAYLIFAGIGAFAALDWQVFDVTAWSEVERAGCGLGMVVGAFIGCINAALRDL